MGADVSILDDVRLVEQPLPKSYLCPNCERAFEPAGQVLLIPAKYARDLHRVIRCPYNGCKFLFAPRVESVALIQR